MITRIQLQKFIFYFDQSYPALARIWGDRAVSCPAGKGVNQYNFSWRKIGVLMRMCHVY